MPSFVIVNGPISKLRYQLRQRYLEKTYANKPPCLYHDGRYDTFLSPTMPEEDGCIEWVCGELAGTCLIYEDNVAGKIDDARFAKISKRYEQEQGENAKKIKTLRLELKKSEGRQMDIDTFLEAIRRYTNATEITQRMVAELIDHIDVYHVEKKDGVTTQHIIIFYNCIGAFPVPDRRKIPATEITMGTRKGVAVSYSLERIAV